jgi:hypothetical protein
MNTLNRILSHVAWFALCALSLTACADNDELPVGNIIIAESELNKTIEWDEVESSISFTANAPWTATVSDVTTRATGTRLSWLTLTVASGEAGDTKMPFVVTRNDNDTYREAQVTIKCGDKTSVITVRQNANPDAVHIMDVAKIPDYDKYYCPGPGNEGFEKGAANMLRSDARYSWWRSRQSEHFFVFWEPGFGDDPNAETVPEALRVDIDDLLAKAEQMYKTNTEKLKMVTVGQGRSQLDRYKMEIYLLYQTEWLATGSGYDNVIGALWVNPSTCKPVGQTIAHEIGHCFQYQGYCDKIMSGGADDMHSNFRYGLDGSNGGNAFWEQCAQWQSFQDYPEVALTGYDINVWFRNCHRHFEHEFMRYASYWLQYYWEEKHGATALGRVWNESKYPEDAIGAYLRIFCNNSYSTLQKELYEYAAHAATFDFDATRQYADPYIDRYSTKMYSACNGFYQVAYAQCPGATGFNVIPLDVPKAGTTVAVELKGLHAGAPLAADDPGTITDTDEKPVGTTATYNAVGADQGWAYGLVALKDDGRREYSAMNLTYSGSKAEYKVPAGTAKLFVVVQGSPKAYHQSPWDEKADNDLQCPYRLKVSGTALKGYFSVDTHAEPQDLDLVYNLSCNARSTEYQQGTINLMDNGDIRKVCRALAMEPSTLSGKTAGIANGETGTPEEGKVVLGLENADGEVAYHYTSNTGFYVASDGSVGSWADNAPVWMEYDRNNFVITFGHKPGASVEGRKYTMRPVLVYMKNGKLYKVKFTLNLQF